MDKSLAAEFEFDKRRKRNNVEDNVGEKHGASEKKIEPKIEPKAEVVVVGRMSQMVALHQVVGPIGVAATLFFDPKLRN